MRKKLLSLSSSVSTQPPRVNFWLLHAVTQSLFLCLLCFPPHNADIGPTKYNYGMFSRIATNGTCRVHIYIIISGRADSKWAVLRRGRKAQTTSVPYPHIRKWGLTAVSASLCLSVDVCRPVLQPEWTGVGVSQALIRAVWNPPLSTLLPPSEQKWVVSSTGHLLLEEALSSDMHCPSLSFTSPLFHLSSHRPVSSSASNIWRHLLPSHPPPYCSLVSSKALRSP